MSAQSSCKRLAIVVGGLSILGGVSPATAQDDPVVIRAERNVEVRVERVPFGDLNLTTKRGEKFLIHRVRGAIHRVCVNRFRQMDDLYPECARIARNDTRPQIRMAVRQARELARTGGTSSMISAITIVGN